MAISALQWKVAIGIAKTDSDFGAIFLPPSGGLLGTFHGFSKYPFASKVPVCELLINQRQVVGRRDGGGKAVPRASFLRSWRSCFPLLLLLLIAIGAVTAGLGDVCWAPCHTFKGKLQTNTSGPFD